MQHWLEDLPGMYATAAVELIPGAAPPGDGSRHMAVSGSPAPLRLDVLNLLSPAAPGGVTGTAEDQHGAQAVIGILESWERDWRSHRDLPVVGAWATLPQAVTALCRWLDRHLDWACANHPAIADFYGELGRCHRALRIALGDRDIRPKIGTCPVILDDGAPCGGRLAMTGENTVQCQDCGTAWAQDRWLLLGQTLRQGGAA